MNNSNFLNSPFADEDVVCGESDKKRYRLTELSVVAGSEEKKKTKLAAMSLMISLVSFLGFCTENIFMGITIGYMDNRNMHLPFLLGYGLAIIALYMMFATPKSPKFFCVDIKNESKAKNILMYFLLSFLCVSIGEVMLGTFVEKTFGIVWWDYTGYPMTFTKYTSIPTSFGFACLITLFMGVFFDALLNAFSRINKTILYKLSVAFALLLCGDFLISAIKMATSGKLMVLWSVRY